MKINVKEIAIFGMLGAMMYASDFAMEALPNIHLVGVFIVAITVVYRAKALYPIYIYVFLNGLFSGFNLWWIAYLYIWTVLWGAIMLLPKNLPSKIQPIVYITVCALHGFLFGILYAPFQAIAFGLNFKGMVAWVISGLYFDLVHGISNLFLGILIFPIISVLRQAEKHTR